MDPNRAISISKFDVDPEGENLQLIVDCPDGYSFTKFILETYNGLYKNQPLTNVYDISSIVDASDLHATHFSVLIPLSPFNVDGNGNVIPSMYRIIVGVTALDSTSMDACSQEFLYPPIDDTYAWTSDLRSVFDCMLSEILTMDPCKGLSDDIMRTEVILLGHLLALKYGRIEEALLYFLLLSNCGKKCAGNHNCSTSCNCGCHG